MNYSNNCVDIDKINSQLEKAEIKKRKLICKIYREYELYLNLLRDLLYISVKKGLNELFSYSSIKDNALNESEIFNHLEKKISKLIYSKLPLITIEQLKIKEIQKSNSEEINFNNLIRLQKSKDDQKEKLQHEEVFHFTKSLEFQISEDISDTSDYYQAENDEKFSSLDLDENDHIKNLSNNNIFENIGGEKQFISSILELIDVVKIEHTTHSEKYNINEINIYPRHQSLKNFELIDKSLENLLLVLSYKVNQELYKANVIKKMISQDSFEYFLGNKFMIKHPHPFVINLEININHPSNNGDNLLSIVFFNISTVELEFKNLILSIQRNKINQLKNQFQRLIKKEKYWKQKEITLNKIC